MLYVRSYDRDATVAYASRWALGRNPRYMDFSFLGGDCTAFASQCLYAGAQRMNYSPNEGWYYIDPNHRSPSWSDVRFFRRFLLENEGEGPYATEVEPEQTLPGDLIQLKNGGRFYHTLVVLHKDDGEIYIAAHTFDALDRPLSSYYYEEASGLHVEGVRVPPA
jgi:hypothetical protein